MRRLDQLVEARFERGLRQRCGPPQRRPRVPAHGEVQHALEGLALLPEHLLPLEDHVLLGLGHQDLLLGPHAGGVPGQGGLLDDPVERFPLREDLQALVDEKKIAVQFGDPGDDAPAQGLENGLLAFGIGPRHLLLEPPFPRKGKHLGGLEHPLGIGGLPVRVTAQRVVLVADADHRVRKASGLRDLVLIAFDTVLGGPDFPVALEGLLDEIAKRYVARMNRRGSQADGEEKE